MINLFGDLLFLVTMFFAWAIGGEQYFGKWKRGALLAIPMSIIALFTLPYYLIAIQIVVLWAVYQALFYDDGIKAVYGENKPLKGWGIIGINGALIGLTAICFMIHSNSIAKVIIAELGAILGFSGVVLLANDNKFINYRIWLNTYMPIRPYFNFRDAWYVSSGLMGIILGVIILWLS